MKISIGFSGPAGSGVNTAGILLAELLSVKGYQVHGDKEYASIIKGDNNCFFLYISDKEETFIHKKIDYFLAYDSYAISKNESIYDLQKTFMIKDQPSKYKNTFTFGAALKILGIPLNEGKDKIQQQFSDKEFTKEVIDQNFLDLEAGYHYIEENCGDACNIVDFSKQIGSAKQFMYGNELIAQGALASGADFYAAYPMTPASTIIDEIIKDENLTFYQGEDEIAVSMAMLGAKFAGKRALCGTSGGGFALMSESISFSNQAEIGGVYVLSQRDGPSTGTPTFTSQGDLNFALNASFGDTQPIVFAPSSFQETYNFIGKALNRSDQYQHPVIFLVDKQLSESYLSIDPKTLIADPIKRGKKVEKTDEDTFKRYELTEDGISADAIPGDQFSTFIASSYEHDEYGFTNEEPQMKIKMMEKRTKKIQTFIQTEFNSDFYGYEVINPDAETFYITFGINRYAIQEAIKGNKKLGLIIIKTFFPFDTRLKTFLEKQQDKIQELIFVEMNHSGILEDLVRKECELFSNWNDKISHQRKIALYPIFEEEMIR